MEIKEAIEELQKDIDWAEQKRYPYITTRRVEAVRLAIKYLKEADESESYREEQ